MKKILITGANGLIGNAISRSLSTNYKVINTDITGDNLNFNLDVTNELEVSEVLNNLDFNTVIHCAYPKSKGFNKNFFDTSLTDFNDNLNLQLGGAFNILKSSCVKFSKNGGGNIILIGSVSGVMNPRFETYENLNFTTPISYSCIKSALISMAKYASKFMANTNTRINVVSPSGIYANQAEIFVKRYRKYCLDKGLLDVEDLIGTIEFLINDSSRYINGQNIIIDDGFTLY